MLLEKLLWVYYLSVVTIQVWIYLRGLGFPDFDKEKQAEKDKQESQEIEGMRDGANDCGDSCTI